MTLRLVTQTWRGCTAAVLFRDRQLHDLAIDNPAMPRLYQSIWRARVGRIAPGLGAFVALGEGRTGLLKEGAHTSGDSVLVQVKSLRGEGKADIVTKDIALPGRFLIYLPNASGFKVSRRSGGEVAPSTLEALKVAGIEGGILRRNAAAAPAGDVIEEGRRLYAIWTDIANVSQPGLLKEGPAASDRLITDYASEDIGTGMADDDLGERLDELLQPRVDLGSGASLLIERTAALTAIDVNTGMRTPGEANALAAGEIARHIRLRNLSGLIMIDFASEQARPKREALLDKLHRALADDPAGCRIAGTTPSGLIELTRPRRTPPLAEIMHEAVS